MSDKPKKIRRPTIKQQKFAELCVNDPEVNGNATEAAMRVYNCSDRKSANVLAAHTMASPSVQNLIQGLRQKNVQEMGMTLTRFGSIERMVESAHGDLESNNAYTRSQARKFLLECYKFVGQDNIILNDNRRVTLKIPER